jgi:flagellar biosynthesis protein FlhF
MKVKKFEARSMKEALELVKTQLGPDAVILAAKEVRKNFGLNGDRSIEITAAYSENILQNRKFVETKLPDTSKAIFAKSTAKKQKEIMQKVIENQLRRSQEESRKNSFVESRLSTPAPHPLVKPKIANLRYIDIADEDESLPPPAATIASRQILNTTEAPILTQQAQQIWGNMEVQDLKLELQELKTLLREQATAAKSTNTTQAHPGFEFGVNFHMCSHFNQLTGKGIEPEYAAQIISEIQKRFSAKMEHQETVAQVGKVILNSITTSETDKNKFHFFLGPSGAGKTSTMIKLASHLVMKENKTVALISTDNIKLGAEQEVRLYSQILNLPFISIRNSYDWQKILPHLDEVDCVLVDTAGLSLSTDSERKYLEEIMTSTGHKSTKHLVLSTLTDPKLIDDYITNYLDLEITDICFTGLDQVAKPGIIFNVNHKYKLPLFSFGLGSKIPEDFEFATPERVVDLILEITKKQNVETINEIY